MLKTFKDGSKVTVTGHPGWIAQIVSVATMSIIVKSVVGIVEEGEKAVGLLYYKVTLE